MDTRKRGVMREEQEGILSFERKGLGFPSLSPIVQSYAERFREDGRLADSMVVMAATSTNRSPHDLQRVCRNCFTTRPPDGSQSSTTSAKRLRPHRGQVRDANRTDRRPGPYSSVDRFEEMRTWNTSSRGTARGSEPAGWHHYDGAREHNRERPPGERVTIRRARRTDVEEGSALTVKKRPGPFLRPL